MTPIRVLASDYDGTLARQGQVSRSTIQALLRWKDSGHFAVLVTGRELSELKAIFPELSLFDRVVAENGGVIYAPQSGRTELLGDAPSKLLVSELRSMGVAPLSVGECIIATVTPYDITARELIAAHRLLLQVILNKESVMILPEGLDKASGLKHALKELGLRTEECVAVGDAENDHVLFDASGVGAAVENAIPSLKHRAQLTLSRPDGDGVSELIDLLLKQPLSPLLKRA